MDNLEVRVTGQKPNRTAVNLQKIMHEIRAKHINGYASTDTGLADKIDQLLYILAVGPLEHTETTFEVAVSIAIDGWAHDVLIRDVNFLWDQDPAFEKLRKNDRTAKYRLASFLAGCIDEYVLAIDLA